MKDAVDFRKADNVKSNTLAEGGEEEGGGMASIHIPVEVVEGILSRLPVKSLIRFQSACKLWRTIISDPQFRRIHYESTHTKINLYWVRLFDSVHPDRLVRVDNKIIKTRWVVESPFDESVKPSRSCNGIFLMVDEHTRAMVLWNLFIKNHYCWIEAPPEHNRDGARAYGFYYDPIVDDYRIAVISRECYTIYSCKSANWSELKPYPSIMPARLQPDEGFNVNGSSSFYWLYREMGEIVCFDFGDEKLSKLQLPTGADWDAYSFNLAAMAGRLCLLGRKRGHGKMFRLWVMEKQDHSWRELIHIEKGERPMHLATPCILTNQDTVVLSIKIKKTSPIFNLYRLSDNILAIYNLRDKRLKDFGAYMGKFILYVLPYSESLNFPVPRSF